MPVGWFEEGERTRILYHGASGLHFHAWIREKLSGLYGGMRQRGAEALLTDAAFVDRAYVAAPRTRGPSWSLVGSGWSWRRGVASSVEEARRQFWADLTASTGETPETFIERSRAFRIGVGVAEFRTNGFVAHRAGRTEGVLTTHPLEFEGKRLTVNAAAASGSVAVEVLDAAGGPLPGFGRADCRLGAFDGVDQPVTWRNRADLAAVKRPVRLRFHLRSADLFGFRIR
jgi:hypothetical protein